VARIQKQLADGTDVDEIDFQGDTGLIHAIREKREDVVELLLRSGADLDRTDGNRPSPREEASRAGLSSLID
jgi:ankyrin repeat protein